VLYLAGNWLMLEDSDEHAPRKSWRKRWPSDKKFPAALNDLAYLYARNRQFDKAFTDMDRYVVLLPNEPNPQDSYGRTASHVRKL